MDNANQIQHNVKISPLSNLYQNKD